MQIKSCSCCKIEKPLVEFSKDCSKKSGYRSYCLVCSKLKSRKHYNENKEKEIKRCSEYNKANPDKHRKHSTDYYNRNKKIINKKNTLYQKKKQDIDPVFKLRRLLRDRLRKALKNNYKLGSAVRDLGCSIGEFKNYIETQFKEGMTWENHGKWHLDHIKPLALFNLLDREQFLQACHFTNLQPLWAEENLKKSDKYEDSKTN